MRDVAVNRRAEILWLVLVLIAAGAILRGLRLDWQPIWWDEGYSLYFATEPLGRMAALTANDIHPPLYYAILHGWLRLLDGLLPMPEAARLLSVVLGVLALPLQYALGRALFPASRRVALIALLLLAFSPIHLYYSQEIRMYGLALLLGMAASLALWRWMEAAVDGRNHWAAALAYLLAGTAALYTLYYAALLLAGHAVWAVVRLRRQRRGLLTLLGIYLLMFLLYLPWLRYALPLLTGYVSGKVQSDADVPLGPLAYVERHLVAFTAGPVQWSALPAEWVALAPATIAICAMILGLVLRRTLKPRREGHRLPQDQSGGGNAKRHAESDGLRADLRNPPDEAALAPVSALWTWLLIPLLLGWLVNLRLPFFPLGGERLLLVTLPAFLLLLALGIDRTWNVLHLGKLAAALLAINALLGIAAFYTTPRYTDEDYRPLLRLVQESGRDEDTLLAIFPWQVGYQKAYDAYARDTRDAGNPTVAGPQPLLLGDAAVEWSPALERVLNAALQRGTLWFPEPLALGSTLPPQIEEYLSARGVNLENRWFGATRLTAWAQLPAPTPAPLAADFGPVQLVAAGSAPAAITQPNQPLAATLVWANGTSLGRGGDEPSSQGRGSSSLGRNGDDLNVSFRVQDADGYVWASREYVRGLPAAGETVTETVGMVTPNGLPPGLYQVAVSVQTADGQPLTLAGSDAAAVIIGEVEIAPPAAGTASAAISSVRLPIQYRLAQPLTGGGLALLGYSGPGAKTQTEPLRAGEELAATLFFAHTGEEGVERHLYLSLLDEDGAGVAGYEGWPLPAYPTSAWPQAALVQVPAAFYLPAGLPSGDYRLVAGLVDPATGQKTPPVELATVTVHQRTPSLTRPSPGRAFPDPPQIGTHALLLGYDLTPIGDGQQRVTLYWEVLQSLLPPHHIFVHLDTPEGATVAQQDGPPITAQGRAPTGSWQPGEFLTTVHDLPAPSGDEASADYTLRAGLYNPQTQVRLPVTVAGEAAGDSVELGE